MHKREIIVVKKIDPPKVSDISIADGQQDVNLDTTYTVTFDRLMDKTTLTANNLYVLDSNGNKITGSVKNVEENDRTISTLTLPKNLQYDSDYTFVVTLSVRDADGYFLDNQYERSFHTRPQKFQVNTTIAKGDELLDSLAGLKKNETLTATLNLRNFAGDASEPYFVAAAIVDGEGRQNAYKSTGGTLPLSGSNPGTDVLVADFKLTEDMDANCKVKFYVWESMSSRNIHWDVITLP